MTSTYQVFHAGRPVTMQGLTLRAALRAIARKDAAYGASVHYYVRTDAA